MFRKFRFICGIHGVWSVVSICLLNYLQTRIVEKWEWYDNKM